MMQGSASSNQESTQDQKSVLFHLQSWGLGRPEHMCLEALSFPSTTSPSSTTSISLFSKAKQSIIGKIIRPHGLAHQEVLEKGRFINVVVISMDVDHRSCFFRSKFFQPSFCLPPFAEFLSSIFRIEMEVWTNLWIANLLS